VSAFSRLGVARFVFFLHMSRFDGAGSSRACCTWATWVRLGSGMSFENLSSGDSDVANGPHEDCRGQHQSLGSSW
jgi:hypothetical protein